MLIGMRLVNPALLLSWNYSNPRYYPQVLQVNLDAVWIISRDAGRHMLLSRGGVSGGEPVAEGAADANPRGRGKIINVASLVSFQGELERTHSTCSVFPSTDQLAKPFPDQAD
jgi:NAD(P)-dependent dehydrogenase (short-subunit alcohol dehydrogenase family)